MKGVDVKIKETYGRGGRYESDMKGVEASVKVT